MDLVDDEEGKLFMGDRVLGGYKGGELETLAQSVEGVKEKGGLAASRTEEIENEPLKGSDEAVTSD